MIQMVINTDLILYIGSKEIMDILIKNGADIYHTNRDGYSALIFAAKHGNLKYMKHIGLAKLNHRLIISFSTQ